MRVVFHPEAEAELASAAEWYDEQEFGLGNELEQEVYEALDLIVNDPKAWVRWPGDEELRLFPLARFPYLIPYAIRDQAIVVLAVAHAKRRPGYWRSRFPQR